MQLPLRLGWAASIHKVQGASLDCAHIDFSRCFDAGQAYTALSRMRRLDGCSIHGLALHHMRAVNGDAVRFYAALRKDAGAV